MPIVDEESGETLSVITADDPDQVGKQDLPKTLPILPVRNTVLFPGVVIPITVGRKKSIRLVKKAYRGDRTIGVVAQQNSTSEDPILEDLYKVGTVAKIIKMLVLPDGNTTIIIQGQKRFSFDELLQEDPNFMANVKYIEEQFPDPSSKEVQGLVQSRRTYAKPRKPVRILEES